MADVSLRLTVWLVTLPLAVAGTQTAHAIAYRLAVPTAHERAHELGATGHGYMAYLPLALGMGAMLVTYAFVAEMLHLTRSTKRVARRPQAWHFAIVAPALFACQEHIERLFHDGTFPFGAALETTFLLGFALQLPFALLAYLVARLLLRVARLLAIVLVRPRLSYERSPSRWTHPAASDPDSRFLATALGPRGPPSLCSV